MESNWSLNCARFMMFPTPVTKCAQLFGDSPILLTNQADQSGMAVFYTYHLSPASGWVFPGLLPKLAPDAHFPYGWPVSPD